MLDLMEEKGYDQVTVEELTERADIGRTTFYLHYGAKQDLLLEQFGELLDQLVVQLSQIPLSSWQKEGESFTVDDHPSRPICMIFQHAFFNMRLITRICTRLCCRGKG
jgi:AcrR family transcriptional regulator